jgi:hypothetical protein
MQSNSNCLCGNFLSALAPTELQFAAILNSHLIRTVLISWTIIYTQISDSKGVSILSLPKFLIPFLVCPTFRSRIPP